MRPRKPETRSLGKRPTTSVATRSAARNCAAFERLAQGDGAGGRGDVGLEGHVGTSRVLDAGRGSETSPPVDV